MIRTGIFKGSNRCSFGSIRHGDSPFQVNSPVEPHSQALFERLGAEGQSWALKNWMQMDGNHKFVSSSTSRTRKSNVLSLGALRIWQIAQN